MLLTIFYIYFCLSSSLTVKKSSRQVLQKEKIKKETNDMKTHPLSYICATSGYQKEACRPELIVKKIKKKKKLKLKKKKL